MCASADSASVYEVIVQRLYDRPALHEDWCIVYPEVHQEHLHSSIYMTYVPLLNLLRRVWYVDNSLIVAIPHRNARKGIGILDHLFDSTIASRLIENLEAIGEDTYAGADIWSDLLVLSQYEIVQIELLESVGERQAGDTAANNEYCSVTALIRYQWRGVRPERSDSQIRTGLLT